MTKFCKDCAWCEPHETHGIEYAKCLKCLIPGKINLVSGESTKAETFYCNIARNSHEKCGPEGKLWEAK